VLEDVFTADDNRSFASLTKRRDTSGNALI